MAKKQNTVLVSPVSQAAYAWLQNPDEGQEFSDGKYKVTLVLDKSDKDVKGFIKQLTDAADAEAEKEWGDKPKKMRYPYKDGDDTGKEEFEGKWQIVCKTKFQPIFIGRDQKPLPEDTFPMSGDDVMASFALIPYKAGGLPGIAAQLRTVMLVEKRNHGSGGAGDFAHIPVGETNSDEEDFDDL